MHEYAHVTNIEMFKYSEIFTNIRTANGY